MNWSKIKKAPPCDPNLRPEDIFDGWCCEACYEGRDCEKKPIIRDANLDLKALFEAGERAREEIASWPKSKRDLVKQVHDGLSK